MHYNDWIERLLERLDRRKVQITFSPHLFGRREYWGLDLGKIEETVRFGKVAAEKCMSGKLCFSHYFGKDNLTYTVLIYKEFVEVRTAWPRKGR